MCADICECVMCVCARVCVECVMTLRALTVGKVCVYVYVNVCVYVCMGGMYVCMYVCLYACMYVYR